MIFSQECRLCKSPGLVVVSARNEAPEGWEISCSNCGDRTVVDDSFGTIVAVLAKETK